MDANVYNAGLMAAGCALGFTLWNRLRKREHVHQFTTLFYVDLDPSQFAGIGQVSSAGWCFAICESCKTTREAIGIIHPDLKSEIFACEPQDNMFEEEVAGEEEE